MNYLYDMMKSKRWRNSRGEEINIITKFKRHYYYHCQGEHESGEARRSSVVKFFEHIAGDSPDPNFPTHEWQNSAAWESQVGAFRTLCEPLFSKNKLEDLRHGVFTSRIETLHSVMLLYAPKTKLFLTTMRARTMAAVLS